mmetsp:Transcript_5259/g.10507  ORF Transcript_5259/g.10507 Transcript_5259/m.10507 type:complete len:219 (+) Transcript_5259:237-893(+)
MKTCFRPIFTYSIAGRFTGSCAMSDWRWSFVSWWSPEMELFLSVFWYSACFCSSSSFSNRFASSSSSLRSSSAFLRFSSYMASISFTLALRCREACWFTTCSNFLPMLALPPALAQFCGVSRSLLKTCQFAPFSIRAIQASSFPFLAAKCIGVCHPNVVLAFGSAPAFFIRYSITSECPSAAALCNAVTPLHFVLFTFSPSHSISCRTRFTLPSLAAR